MSHEFDQDYWNTHWEEVDSDVGLPPNPHLVREVARLPRGTALEAGCGEGVEAIWLARAGWTVTAVDISAGALGRAKERASAQRFDEGAVSWLQADLATWEPAQRFDLVTTHYAHPAIPQLELYVRLSRWVAPGGSLLVVGHLPGGGGDGDGDGHGPPREATATADSITARLDPQCWDVVTAEETSRTVDAREGRQSVLHDVVVRAARRG